MSIIPYYSLLGSGLAFSVGLGYNKGVIMTFDRDRLITVVNLFWINCLINVEFISFTGYLFLNFLKNFKGNCI